MRTLLAALVLAVPLMASPVTCQPNMAVDHVTVAQSCFDTPLVTLPGSTSWLSEEDLPAAFADFDANDLAALVHFSDSQAQFTYQGHLSDLYSELLVDGAPIFSTLSAPGTTATVSSADLSVGFRVFYPGYAPVTYALPSANTVTFCISGCAANVPEPSAASLLGVGLLTIALVNGFLYLWALPSIKARRRARIIRRVREQSADPLWIHICDEVNRG